MLAGLTAVITGAGAGLGRAEALALAESGAFVVLNDAADTVHDVASAIEAAGGRAVAVTGDIGDWETGVALVDACLRETGRLDIVVNNAGVLRDRMIFSMSAEEWDLVLRVHLRGHFIMTRLATAHWRALAKEAGGPVYGRLVNTSSEAFLLGSPGQPNYAAAKAGIVSLTVATARACARYGVRANAICPRGRTAMTVDVMGSAPPAGPDPLDPAYVAPLVVWLSSPTSAGVNGEVFVVHGGVCAVMNPPSVRTVFRSDAPDGMWSLGSMSSALDGAFGGDGMAPGFACEDTLPLADSTIGFD